MAEHGASLRADLSSHLNGVLRRLDDLTTEEMLALHREVCRRAAFIYEPRYREKREANYRLSFPGRKR